MNKLFLVTTRVAAIYGLVLLSPSAIAASGDQANATEDEAVATQNVFELEDGRTVPAQRLDGSGAAKRASTGGVIYGQGVYVTRNGIVRSNGKIVRKLGPGEGLSMDDLEGFVQNRPGSSARVGRSESSLPPAGRSDISGAPDSVFVSPGADSPANAGVSTPPDKGASDFGTGAIASPDRPTRRASSSGEEDRRYRRPPS